MKSSKGRGCYEKEGERERTRTTIVQRSGAENLKESLNIGKYIWNDLRSIVIQNIYYILKWSFTWPINSPLTKKKSLQKIRFVTLTD